MNTITVTQLHKHNYYLSRLGLAVAQLGNKVLAVSLQDTVGQQGAHQTTGLLHHLVGRPGLILVVQDVVDPPLVVPHYLIERSLAHPGSVAHHGHHAVGSGPRVLRYGQESTKSA